MKKDDFEKLKVYFQNECKLTDENILKKTLQMSNLFHEVQPIFSKEYKILKLLEIEKNKLYGQLYHYYKYGKMEGKEDFKFTLETKSEIDSYIKSDELYYNKMLEYANQEIIVEYLKEIIKNINNIGYNIKNYIDLQKVYKGIV
ncbi:MAG: recombination mediator protein UvsY [Candidatus Nanoarchaeia archaeon]|jgi:hypothetical protein|nr:recombination mediator protein UvsY [Candidatus Nanoarchaeia archaeon]